MYFWHHLVSLLAVLGERIVERRGKDSREEGRGHPDITALLPDLTLRGKEKLGRRVEK